MTPSLTGGRTIRKLVSVPDELDMIRANQLDIDRAFVLIIDLQAQLLPTIGRHGAIVTATCKLLEGTTVFSLPVLATEQYPKGIGHTVPEVRRRLKALDAEVFEKNTFSACDDPNIGEALRRIDRPQVIMAGIEAHICVQQTALDLRTMDYDVFVCADAVGSRGRMDYEQALHRMRQADVLVTTVESVLFELCNQCDTDRFKGMLEVIKAHPPAD